MIVSSYDIYSEDEKEVGVFLDGKPLYQKTINTGALPNNTTKNVNHNISNIDTVVTAFGFAKASGINWIPIPFVNNTAYTDQVALFVNPTTITLRTSGDRSAYGQSYVTIKYTKTTDAAGSGLFVPSGAGAVHYSTEEQVIGTYLGNTLYSKTISIPSATMTNGTMNIVVSADYSNVDKLVSWECNIYDPTLQRNFNIPYIRITDSESLYLLVHRISDHTVNAAIFCRGSGYNNRTFQNSEFSLQYTKTA